MTALVSNIIDRVSSEFSSYHRFQACSGDLGNCEARSVPEFIKEFYCQLDFVNEMALNDEITKK